MLATNFEVLVFTFVNSLFFFFFVGNLLLLILMTKALAT